jgi:hypothetical protein
MQAGIEKAQAKNPQDFPPFMAFVFRHFYLLFVLFLVVSASTLAAAIGLLMRKNWARVLFVGMMGLGILLNLVGIVIMLMFFLAMPEFPPPRTGGPAPPQNFGALMAVIMGMNALMAVAFAVLFGWIIKRLISPEIMREFGVFAG